MPRHKTIQVILVDNREQLPYLFSDYDIQTMPATLQTGDYSVAIKKGDELTCFDHLIDIERKSLDNWVSDISNDENRERLEASIERGSHLEYYAVFIEGSTFDVLNHKYEGDIKPKSVLNTAYHWSVNYCVPIEFVDNRFEAEYRTYTALMAFLKYQKKRSRPVKPAQIPQIQVVEQVGKGLNLMSA